MQTADWISAACVVGGFVAIVFVLVYYARQPRLISDALQDVFSAMASLKMLIVSLRDSALLAHAELAAMRATARLAGQDTGPPLLAQITVEDSTLTVPAEDVGSALKHMAQPVPGATIFAKIEYCSREFSPAVSSPGGGND